MSDEDDLFGPGRQRALAPSLNADSQTRLINALRVNLGVERDGFAKALRSLAREWIDDGESVELRAMSLLVADLFEQGWRINLDTDRIVFEPPGLGRGSDETIEQVKQRVRSALLVGRDRQLKEPSVRDFIARMERPVRRIGAAKTSISTLIDDGRALAGRLREIASLPADEAEAALRGVVDPVIEVCEADAKCPDTGLALIDIWRYFRHTWAHEYRSIPGRQLMVLVRNAARPNRPVMGIAMLASPVMRLTKRDEWIGWLRPAAQERLLQGEWHPDEFRVALLDRIEASLQEIRWDDFMSLYQFQDPTQNLIFRLEQRAYGAAQRRESELRAAYEAADRPRPEKAPRGREPDWIKASEDALFVQKRAAGLAQLLQARRIIGAANTAETFMDLFRAKAGQRAIDIALAELRKAGLSSQVVDVSVCGAVHPYNELLGGKLVALILASSEVRDIYARRYGGQISVITSQMAGRAVTKPAELKILTTTSLYGLNSSQYNRLVLRAARHPGLPRDLEWVALGKSLTKGFGTLHLGADTVQALRQMGERRHDARRINNRFGEGTSPRLRQIREGLDALGIESDQVLHHATPRIFYGCELIDGARTSLVFGDSYSDRRLASVDQIGEAWRTRWLAMRIKNSEVLDRVERLGPVSIKALFSADDEGQFELSLEG